jgi:hypothetical protein
MSTVKYANNRKHWSPEDAEKVRQYYAMTPRPPLDWIGRQLGRDPTAVAKKASEQGWAARHPAPAPSSAPERNGSAHAPAPIVPPVAPISGARRELEVMAGVLDLLAGLDDAAVGRVLRWVGERVSTPGA